MPAARWEALGLERLTFILPPSGETRFVATTLGREATERVQARCEEEGASLNGALAVAMRDVMGLDSVAHAVGMERFIRPAPPLGRAGAGGVARLHQLDAPGEFWDSRSSPRISATLFEEIKAGAAGDALLSLPPVLLRPDTPLSYDKAVMTITGAPTVGAGELADGISMELVVSSARGGGGILILSYDEGCLQLIGGAAGGQPDVPLAALVERLDEVVRQ